MVLFCKKKKGRKKILPPEIRTGKVNKRKRQTKLEGSNYETSNYTSGVTEGVGCIWPHDRILNKLSVNCAVKLSITHYSLPLIFYINKTLLAV